MFAKILLTAVIALATLVIFRQVSERNKKDRIRVKNDQRRPIKTKNLVWDEKSQSYRDED
ncbi:hypothetical protein MNBD_ALPHA08-979 [hydrothermal vent metagenome]|uniref:Uncharacterized protein n=1 Tax=hydrothermal vent metagenome TaxID=652676 RepID=A0A3B0R2J4_9ZZZZ